MQVSDGGAADVWGPSLPLVQDSASGSSSDASFASVLGNTCPRAAAPTPHSCVRGLPLCQVMTSARAREQK